MGAAVPVPPEAALLWAPKVNGPEPPKEKPDAELAGAVLCALPEAALAPKVAPLLAAPKEAAPEAPNAKGMLEGCPLPSPYAGVPAAASVPCPKAGVLAAAPNDGPLMLIPKVGAGTLPPPPKGPVEGHATMTPRTFCTSSIGCRLAMMCVVYCLGRVVYSGLLHPSPYQKDHRKPPLNSMA